jgi:hypothetical protein
VKYQKFCCFRTCYLTTSGRKTYTARIHFNEFYILKGMEYYLMIKAYFKLLFKVKLHLCVSCDLEYAVFTGAFSNFLLSGDI